MIGLRGTGRSLRTKCRAPFFPPQTLRDTARRHRAPHPARRPPARHMRVPPPRLAPRLAPSKAACTASPRQAIAAALLLPPPLGAAPPPAHAAMLIPNLRPPPASAARALTGAVQRWGAALLAASVLTAAPFTPPAFAASASCDTSRVEAPSGAFRSAAFEKPNYSSAIVASRDTNVSPREAYDIIAERAVQQYGQSAPLAVLQLGSCASSGHAWRLWAARHSQEEAGPLGAQPLPRMLELAASEAADVTAFDHAGAV